MANDDGMEYACKPVDHGREIETVILENQNKWHQAVDNPALLGWFVGQVMKRTGGKANPVVVNKLLEHTAKHVKNNRKVD